jgi:hypothetical protein
MPGKRKVTEEFIVKWINELTKNTENANIYKKIFAVMTDDDFDKFITDIESGKRFLSVITPNFSSNQITVENNLKVADELGHDFFQRLWIEGNDETPSYLTPNKFMVVDLPTRRASQLLIKKISIPKHNKVIDSLTGQPTGESKGAKISYPEMQLCAAMGLDNCMIELMKYRGGDARGGAALNAMLSTHGSANIKTLSQFASGVESTNTLRTYLSCMHFKSTL